ncbi:conserved hypothetical protein [Ricinus communis]|uniref:Leucine-rich repeat-containing N-terminal plant-type domain-containing protein n=1 Tax=Ricinus communis TaxID=3988 RepID=B9SCU5_RICCO|nr:conserved hypothetical protein [Ricinus communis]
MTENRKMSILQWLLPTLLVFTTSLAYTNDLQVLLKLKSSYTGPNGSGLEDWEPSSASPSAHCSSGVACDKDSPGLCGSFHPEIGPLNKLEQTSYGDGQPYFSKDSQHLHNIFGGYFPGEIDYGMTQLEVLEIFDNNVKSPFPTKLTNLKILKHLRLGVNCFSGKIPELYSEIKRLEYLGCNGSSLSGKILASLAHLKNLKHLDLGYFNSYDGGCNLSGEVPASLGRLKHLHALFLSDLISLNMLNLSINYLSREAPESFFRLKNITLLHSFNNNFCGPVREPSRLDLSNNNLSGQNFQLLAFDDGSLCGNPDLCPSYSIYCQSLRSAGQVSYITRKLIAAIITVFPLI